jgi:hypothetical protein
VRRIVRQILIPIARRLLLALALPYAATNGLLPALGVPPLVVSAAHRWSYAGCLLGVVLLRALQGALERGRGLHRVGHHPPAPRLSLVSRPPPILPSRGPHGLCSATLPGNHERALPCR